MSEIRVDTISEKTSANGVAIDSVTLKDGGIAATAASTITVADNSDTLTLSSTDADANNGPKFVLNRDSGSPADGDNCGIIKFKADDDGGNSTELVNISAAFTDVSNGSEDATFNISSVIGGSQMGRIGMSPTETVFNDDSGDIDFRVESNGNTHQLFVDAGTDNVMIGTSVNIDRWFNSAPGHSTIFQTSGFDDANRVNAFTHHSNDSGSAMVMLGKSRGGAVGYTAVAESDEIGQISFQGADGTDMVEAAKIVVSVDAAPGANDMPGRIVFQTTADGASSSTERMRISNTGQTTLTSSINDVLFYVKNTETSGNVFGQQINFSSTVNDTGSYFFRCVGNNNSTVRAVIFANGDFQSATNSYGSTSDERIKQNITDANSQWDDIKALKVRNFKLKDEARTETGGGQAAKTYLGLVAQETETVSPGLVKLRNPEKADILSSSEFGTLYEDGDDIPEGKAIGDIKTTTNEKVKSVSYSVLYMKAIKALQEAQTRIETLETKVAALEG